MPKLRIYQQILICFGLIVTVPLVGATFVINSINQKALKKELGRFTEHTARALYQDFETEMGWQKQNTHLMAQLAVSRFQQGDNFKQVTRQILKLDATIQAVGFYDAQGVKLQEDYLNFSELSPELRLPALLPSKGSGNAATQTKALQPFQVLYFETGNPLDSPYFLRSITKLPAALDQAKYYVQQKSFPYLEKLVRSNNKLYGAFYIIDTDGVIIAGPSGVETQERIQGKDYKQFAETQPGVTREFSSQPQAAQLGGEEGEDAPKLEKVIVKMPEINWGIIIESPYNVKTKYIQRAATQTLLLAISCLALMLVSVLPYILGISRNFRQLIKGVKAMGDGNYFRRIRLLTNFFTPYEIVYLTLEFNRMARKTADSWQTIQEANRKLAEMDEFKSNLIDTVSHEFRTPLTIIKGNASRMLRYDANIDSETRIKNVKAIKQQADRLSRLVEDLLVIPDMEQAKLRVYPDRVLLSQMLENCVQFIQAKEHREIHVSLSPTVDENQHVLADPDRLEQILLNLIDNAIKYSLPETPIQVLVNETVLPHQAHHPQQIQLIVRNACDPVPMQNLEAIDTLFEKFKRLDDSLVRTTRGSGLGLFITRGLVEAMSGEIQLAYAHGFFEVRFTVPVFSELTDAQNESVLV